MINLDFQQYPYASAYFKSGGKNILQGASASDEAVRNICAGDMFKNTSALEVSLAFRWARVSCIMQ
jgi:hypothetical protein